MKTKKKIGLTKKDHKQLSEALSAKDFDEALNLTPARVLDRLFEICGGSEGAHDMFDADVFPKGWKPPSLTEQAKLEARVEAMVKHRKTTRRLPRRSG